LSDSTGSGNRSDKWKESEWQEWGNYNKKSNWAGEWGNEKSKWKESSWADKQDREGQNEGDRKTWEQKKDEEKKDQEKKEEEKKELEMNNLKVEVMVNREDVRKLQKKLGKYEWDKKVMDGKMLEMEKKCEEKMVAMQGKMLEMQKKCEEKMVEMQGKMLEMQKRWKEKENEFNSRVERLEGERDGGGK
jgi:hypothetical protein